MTRGAIGAALLAGLFLGTALIAADPEDGAIPAAFSPFEYLIGSWKGTGVPTANRIRGWPEKHMWAWKFVKGTPVGMTVSLEGNKILTKAVLSYDAKAKRYSLEGTDPAGKPVTFAGTLDAKGKTLTLDRTSGGDDAKERLVLFPNSDQIRYRINHSRQEPGAPRFKPETEIGVGKEGETFAAGGAATEGPKCILTGGAATMTVSYQGKSYPVCCTGCRDEFNDNPEKYVKKAALMAEQGAGKTPVKAATTRKAKDDAGFEGLVDDAKPETKKATSKTKGSATTKPKAEPGDSRATGKATDTKAKAASRAASQLKIAENLEKTGKAAAALKYYKQIVKDYPNTPQATTASARIKALDIP